jgi:signal transduction histidine kinase
MSIIVMISISIASIAIIFYFQDVTRSKVRSEQFNHEKEKQVGTTRFIAQAIESDLDSIRSKLSTLALSRNFQDSDLDSPTTVALIQSQMAELNAVVPVDAIFVVDKNNTLVYSTQTDQFNGSDLSDTEYVKELRETMKVVFSNSFDALDGTRRITVVYPIINQQTGDYVGMVGAGLVADPFFSRYGNIQDFNSGQYLNALDRNHRFVASPNKAVVGLRFEDPAFRANWTKNDHRLNEAYNMLFSGRSTNAVIDIGFGERLLTGEPVFLDGSPKYYITMGIPTSVIYSQADSVLADQQAFQLYQTMAVVAGAVALIALLIRNNTCLGKKVAERTKDLEHSNNMLSQANDKLTNAYERLEIHDKLQEEFINVAAHELRTPIQPLLGAAELLETELEKKEKIEVSRPEIEMIVRNAKRLERLSSDILEISRIESGALKMNKEDFSLAYMISDAVRDARAQSIFDSEKLTIEYQPDDIFVHADREKATQVITNLLTNAIKFTDKGTISITTQKDSHNGFATIAIEDAGLGIDPEILPRLFEKFVTRSDKGTGIGLFISKKIVEAHGGTISGKNNLAHSGATFIFTLPLAKHEPEREKGVGEPTSS